MRTIDHLRSRAPRRSHRGRVAPAAFVPTHVFVQTNQRGTLRKPLRVGRNAPCPNHPHLKYKRCACSRQKPAFGRPLDPRFF